MTLLIKHFWKVYCSARNKAKSVVRKCKREAHEFLFNNKASSKDLWRYLKDRGLSTNNPTFLEADVDELNMLFINNQLDTQKIIIILNFLFKGCIYFSPSECRGIEKGI